MVEPRRGPVATGRPAAVAIGPVRGAGLGLDVLTLDAIAAAGFLGVETVEVPGGDVVGGGASWRTSGSL